jgi:undecaprenyl phosphate N,N'-diacetylbacillosamine 1-phosphate transferase
MPSRRWQLAVKHAGDRVAAGVLLLLLSPAFAVIGLLVWLEDGRPIFFRQDRVGRYGRRFLIWKFRSMVVEADRLLDKEGRVRGDGRITRVGRFLRLTSLDELPQLINIIRGEMSFIGPRPGLKEHYDRYTAAQKRRYDMRPGVTGLAQVNGRNTLPWSRRIAHDLEYIDQFSLWRDVKILAKTIAIVATGKNLVLDRNPELVDDLPPSRDSGGR